MMAQHPEHILLIAMTDAISINELVTSLGQKNYRFLFAGMGEEAICMCKLHPEIELVIADIDLPGINGIETIRRIRQLDTLVPVILLATYIMLETMRLAQNIGCNEILQTPVDQKTLEAIILKYLPVKNTFNQQATQMNHHNYN
ncbi:MAG: response regulator [Bacteroidetes bacterium]|nr:response regulator [Bacteroidota bacterium]